MGRRERRTIPGLAEGQRIYFLYDEDMLDGITAGFKSTDDERECYEAHRDEILAESVKFHPCKRPRAWWRYDHGMDRPKDPHDDFFDRLAEAEALHDMKALTSTEFIHLEDLRSFYQRCREVDGWRWE